jgi:diguanylate cyclase (GGDEF)-like protein
MPATTRSFGFRVALPAGLILLGTLMAVAVSLTEITARTGRMEEARISHAADAAIGEFVDRLGDAHENYARSAIAGRSLADSDVTAGLLAAATWGGTLFDTAYLLDENGEAILAYRKGWRVGEPARTAFGSGLAAALRKLPKDGPLYTHETGLVETKWGLAAVAVGPIVASGAQSSNTAVRRLLVAKALDAPALRALGKALAVDGVVVDGSTGADSIPLVDWSGVMVARLSWSPRPIAPEAGFGPGRSVFIMFGLLILAMGVLMRIAVRGIREIQRREAVSGHAASHDSLTGLPNRAALIQSLDRAIELKRRTNAPCVLVYLDLDGFKEINDAYSHATGDRVIRQVGERFQSLSDENLLARLGGDEFALLVSGPEAKRAARIFARSAIELLGFPFHVDGRTIFVGTSIGIAVADVSDLSAEELLRRADVAMYHAKQQGPNRVFMYDAEIDALRSERIGIASDLRRAIANDELAVVYQPVYDAASRQIVAAEALLRWTRPGAGPMPPSAFIPIAEETGLIDALGAWTLRRACRDALAWSDTRLAVNISPAQFRNANFITMVSDALKETGFPASRLELEVTETYFIAQPELARTAMEALHKIGVSLALDDFGTGYSSIGYLRRFHFDVLKLDRSMILNIATDRSVQNLVQATVALADALDLRVTAEGVETEEEATLLRAAGCREFQGFLFAKPCTPAQFADRLKLRTRPGVLRALSA